MNGKITRQELGQELNDELNKIGNLSEMTTTEKTNLASAVSEVKNDLVAHKEEMETQLNLKANKSQSAYIEGTLQNNWTGSIKYTKNDVGIVTVNISVTAGVVAGLTIISTLPAGYRPISVTSVVAKMRLNTGATDKKDIYLNSAGELRLASDSTFENGKFYEGSLIYYAA